MIELRDNRLNFRFPGVHKEASCSVDFQRTLRIPDDNNSYPLPPGLGRFPAQHVDDFAKKLPEDWVAHGGIFIPMYQSEALWINFHGSYPCAVKIAAGKINAVDGSGWTRTLSKTGQDYVVIPKQPWLDGFNVSEGYIRQFVAMPLGEGYTAEEQITGKAEHGGLQFVIYPMKKERYEILKQKQEEDRSQVFYSKRSVAECSMEMGLAPGGLMRQKIYDDEYGLDAWDQENGLRCFVHLANSAVYADLTGSAPPHKPPTAKDYTAAGLPWFEYYSDAGSIGGSKILGGLKSVGAKIIQQMGKPLPDNDSLNPKLVKTIGAKDIVREEEF